MNQLPNPPNQPKKLKTSYYQHKFNSIYPKHTIGPKLDKKAVAPHPVIDNIHDEQVINPFDRIQPVSQETVVPSINFSVHNSSFYYTPPKLLEMIKILICYLDEEYETLKEVRKLSRGMDRSLWKLNLTRVYEYCNLIEKIGSLEKAK